MAEPVEPQHRRDSAQDANRELGAVSLSAPRKPSPFSESVMPIAVRKRADAHAKTLGRVCVDNH
ncbi:MAG TPA: hypothetical protein VGH45_02630 [Solirubrobacteraceae bacterium]|jgi:hypothetical protein